MKWAAVIIAVFCAVSWAAAQNAAAQDIAAPEDAAVPAKTTKAAKHPHSAPRAAQPLPVVIPQQFAPPQEAYASFPDTEAAAAPAKPSACQVRLSKLAVFKSLPLLVGAGECGATDAVVMDTIILPDQTRIAVTPAATMRCPIAEEIAHWVREDVVPSLKPFGAPLRELDNFDSYECRGRNRVRAAALSEHGRADALDVRDFKLADGRALGLTDVNVTKDWRESIKASACARFSTVLGPGSDGYHEEHIHLDLAERHNGYKVCQWNVREPPPPPPAPGKDKDQETAPAIADAGAQNDDGAQDNDGAQIPLAAVPLPRPRPRSADAATPGSGSSRKVEHN